jgi:acyl-CoA synthetase (AMP-forming)/AMP-acid ligase II/acyl carrier protein
MKQTEKFVTIVDALKYWAAAQPDKTAYRFLPDGEGQPDVVTYAQLLQRVQGIASQLQRWRGERALMLFHSGVEFLETFLACLYAGVIAVPAYPPRRNHNFERLQAIVGDCTPQLILTTENIRQYAEPMFVQAASLDGRWMPQNVHWISTERIDTTVPFDCELPDPTQIAFLQYTSGSTGNPKGVMVSHDNLIYNERIIHSALQIGPEYHVVSWLPLFHDMGLIGAALYPLFTGIDALLMPPAAFLQKPYRWLKAISDMGAEGPVGTVAPNFAWQLCVEQITEEQRATLDLSALKFALTGAEPVRASTLEAFAARFGANGFTRDAFCPCYGLAEATLVVTCAGKREPVIRYVDTTALANNRIVGAGNDETALIGVGHSQLEQQMLIVDPVSGEELGASDIGEIWVAGRHISAGYWQQPQASVATFGNFTSDGRGPFLRTGDIGNCVDGELFVTGRLKDLVIIRGRNLYPQDIEFVVEKSHAALRTDGSAAFTVEQDNEEKLVIVAEIDRSQRLHFDADAVCAAMRRAVTQAFDVSVYAIVLIKPGALLKTSSGKVQRRANRQRFIESGFDALAQWQASPAAEEEERSDFFAGAGDFFQQTPQSMQALLAGWVAHRTRMTIDEIDIGVPFVSYGMDSIDATRLIAALEAWAGFPISFEAIMGHDTIEALAAYLLSIDLAVARAVASHPESIEGTI